MDNSSNLFIKIDDFIFKKLDVLKNDGFFQKFNEVTSNLDEPGQKLIAQLISFTFILIPFTFVLILWWGNFQTKNGLELKKQIIEQIAIFEGNQNTLNNLSANYLSPNAVTGKEDLENRITNILSQNGIDQDKVRVLSFNQTSTSSTVAKIEADLSIKNFGNKDFSIFMRALIERERFKIMKVDFMKNKEDNLLQGTISLKHLGQSTDSSEQY